MAGYRHQWVRKNAHIMPLQQDHDPFDEETRVLQTETLRAEWDALLNAIQQHGAVIHSAAETEAGRIGIVLVACDPENLYLVDRAVMYCFVVEPLHRRAEDDRHIITVRFRNWWRKSVPFLLDPDGEQFHYRYEVMDDEQAPSEEQ